MEHTFLLLENYLFELQTIAQQSLNPDKVSSYLKAIKQTEEVEMCEQMFLYVILTRSKYLQLMSAYFIFKNDTERVGVEFENFNNDFHDFLDSYRAVVGEDFSPSLTPSSILIQTCQNNDAGRTLPDLTETGNGSQKCETRDEMQAFLHKLGLNDLHEMFVKEEITMELLPKLSDDDFKGIGVSKLGHRRKILEAVANLNKEG